MTNETAEHRQRRTDAVGRARTEVDRRRRLRAMAEAPAVIPGEAGDGTMGDDESMWHLGAASYGVLRGRPNGTRPLVFPTAVAVLDGVPG